jgi:hypothetical protein
LSYSTPDQRVRFNLQRVSVNMPRFSDTSALAQLVLRNTHNFGTYLTLGDDRGTQVSDPAKAYFKELGVNFFNPKAGFFAALHKVGSQYAPFDGFNQHNDVAGYSIYTYREFDNAPGSRIQSITIGQNLDSYHGSSGAVNQADTGTSLDIRTRNQMHIGLFSGIDYLVSASGGASMFNQSGASLNLRSGSDTPINFAYNIGRFGAGYLRSWSRNATLKVTPRGSLLLQADGTRWTTDTGAIQAQSLARVTFSYQLGRDASLALGVRRISGAGPFAGAPVLDASNLSLAYHKRQGQNELYVAYGDPSRLQTLPVFLAKFIHYFGAEKGT